MFDTYIPVLKQDLGKMADRTLTEIDQQFEAKLEQWLTVEIARERVRSRKRRLFGILPPLKSRFSLELPDTIDGRLSLADEIDEIKSSGTIAYQIEQYDRRFSRIADKYADLCAVYNSLFKIFLSDYSQEPIYVARTKFDVLNNPTDYDMFGE